MLSTETLQYIFELKSRMMRSLVLITSLFCVFFLFSRSLFAIFSTPVINRLPASYQIISTQVTTPFVVLMKFSFMLALLAGIPYLLYQAWAFIAPGLYRHEKRFIVPLILLSTGLFYIGGAFAFFVVCPLALNFFYHFAPANITVMTDIQAYFGFVLNMLLIFAFSFQIPIVIFCLLHFKWITPRQYQQKRPYMIVGCFILGMLLTPPDVISQILLAVPLILLFELGFLLSKWMVKKAACVPA